MGCVAVAGNPSIGFGIALAGAAAMAYLPFSQRALIQRIYSPPFK